ncbi:MAG: helix-turn-helix domain-containing protein [Persicimonas sp.]
MERTESEQRMQVDDAADIGKAVRSARKAQGLTQREFADVVGVGVRFLSELERGKSTAQVGLVLRVLAGTGYEVVLEPRGWRNRAIHGTDEDATSGESGS